jgi:hypothetical protein
VQTHAVALYTQFFVTVWLVALAVELAGGVHPHTSATQLLDCSTYQELQVATLHVHQDDQFHVWIHVQYALVHDLVSDIHVVHESSVW